MNKMSPSQKTAVWVIVAVVVLGPLLAWLTARRPPRFIALHKGREFYEHNIHRSRVYIFDQPCSEIVVSMKEELRTGGWEMVADDHRRGLVVTYTKNSSGESITLTSPDQFDAPLPKGAACAVVMDTIF